MEKAEQRSVITDEPNDLFVWRTLLILVDVVEVPKDIAQKPDHVFLNA